MPSFAADNDVFTFVPNDGWVGTAFLIEDINDPITDDNRYEAVRGSEVETRNHFNSPSDSLRRATSLVIALNARSTNSSATPVLPLRTAWRPSRRRSA